MAFKFSETNAKPAGNQRRKVPQYKMRENDNYVRLVGGVIPRYIYWVPNQEGVKMPVECLSFSREKQEFDYAEKDHVKDLFPDLEPKWAYASACYDETTYKERGAEGTEVSIFNHKVKLFQQIIDTAEDLGDPCDAENGWPAVFTKVKTGPKVYNVDYVIKPLKCQSQRGPIPADMLEKIDAFGTLDEVLKRQSPEDIKKFLDRITGAASEGIDDEIPEDFN